MILYWKDGCYLSAFDAFTALRGAVERVLMNVTSSKTLTHQLHSGTFPFPPALSSYTEHP